MTDMVLRRPIKEVATINLETSHDKSLSLGCLFLSRVFHLFAIVLRQHQT